MTILTTQLSAQQNSSSNFIKQDLLRMPLHRYERGALSPAFIMRCEHDLELDPLRVPVFAGEGLGWLDWTDPSLPQPLRRRALGCVLAKRMPIIDRVERLQRGRSTTENAAEWFASIVQDAPLPSICAMLDEFLNDHRGWTIDSMYALRPGTGPRGGCGHG